MSNATILGSAPRTTRLSTRLAGALAAAALLGACATGSTNTGGTTGSLSDTTRTGAATNPTASPSAQEPTTGAQPTGQRPTGQQPATSTGDVDMAARGTATAESPESMFADPKIAAVSSSSNQDEIQTSQIAVQKAENAEVKAFAQRMIDEHGRLEQQAQAMLSQKGMAPVDNALSLQKKRNLQAMLDTLRALSGPAFDREYVLHQVASHMQTLHTLDTSLIPHAKDPQLKAMLQEQVRPAVAMHLQEVKRILGTLN